MRHPLVSVMLAALLAVAITPAPAVSGLRVRCNIEGATATNGESTAPSIRHLDNDNSPIFGADAYDFVHCLSFNRVA